MGRKGEWGGGRLAGPGGGYPPLFYFAFHLLFSFSVIGLFKMLWHFVKIIAPHQY